MHCLSDRTRFKIWKVCQGGFFGGSRAAYFSVSRFRLPYQEGVNDTLKTVVLPLAIGPAENWEYATYTHNRPDERTAVCNTDMGRTLGK